MKKILKVPIFLAALPETISADDSEPLDRQLFAMTTVMNLRAYGNDADAALDDAEAEIQYLDGLLSTGSDDRKVGFPRPWQWYLPLLMLAELISGSIMGTLDILILPRIERVWK